MSEQPTQETTQQVSQQASPASGVALTTMDGTTNEKCVFCRIAAHKLESKMVLENESFAAFWDRSPAARVHVLLVPKKHIKSISQLTAKDIPMLAEMKMHATQLLADLGVEEKDRQLGFHQPPFSTVGHLHLHCLGGPITSMFSFLYSWSFIWMPLDSLIAKLQPQN
eukprot:jgi/Hompol1/3667/HPOL_003316-RA